MTMRLLSFAVWALVAATAVFWLTRLASRPTPAPAHAVTAGQSITTANADLSRVLGATRAAATADNAQAPEPAANSRFKLIGVVAARTKPPQPGLALIAVDGKPPKPVETGDVVDGSLVLLAVNHRRAELGPAGGNATVTLELPAVPEPNRSVRTMPVPVAPPPMPVPPQPQMPQQQVLPQVPGQTGLLPQVPPQTMPQMPGVPQTQTAPPPLSPVPGVPRRNAAETR